MIYRNG
jgi:hypothetical protein